jgi:hypothetical protein
MIKRLRFTEEPIIAVLREQEAGTKTADVCRKHGINDATFLQINPASQSQPDQNRGPRQPVKITL